MTQVSAAIQQEAQAAAAPRAGRTGTSRINVILPTAMLVDLRERASREGVTLTEILRYAIGLAGFADQIRDEGGRLIVERPDGRQTEILPRFTARRSAKPAEAAVAVAQTTAV